MEILIFFLIISNLNVILSEDNLDSVESIIDEVQSNQERNFFNDQIAESSQIVRHHYRNVGKSGKLREETETQIRQSEKLPKSVIESHGLKESSSSLIPLQLLQQGPHPQYVQQQQPQHLLLQQYPAQQIQILNAEASPLQQTHENKVPQVLGYSSYVEHLSDEDEINSALKEGSVNDIKRLVPKSGISFTIYQNGKNLDSQNSGTHLNQIAQLNSKPTEVPSVLLQKIKTELPTVLPTVQPVVLTDVHQTSFLDHSILKNKNVKEQQTSSTPQQLLQPHGQYQQNRNTQTVYYTPPTTHSTFVEVKEKSTPIVKPRFKTNAAENNYQKKATATELQRNLKTSLKASKNNVLSVEKQNLWQLNDKGETFQKAVIPVKNLETLPYAITPLTQNEGNTRVTYTQNFGNGAVGLQFNKPKIENSFIETTLQDSGNYFTNAYSTKLNQNNFVGHLTSVPHLDKKVILSHLPGHIVNAEEVKTGHFANHLGGTTTAHLAFKGDQFATTDSETAKTNQFSLINQIPNNYLEVKNIQNFDHQKALQGSTSFDIKNAIDSNGNLVYQTEHIIPTTAEIHPVENTQKQQLTYIIPKIPTSAIIIGGNAHNAEAGGHQTKDYGQSGVTAQFSYQNAGDVGGKFFYQPQTIQLTSDHFNQETPIVTKDLHQHLLRLHLPKEEVYVKTQNVGYPSHITLPQQKQPLVLHYELPILKSSPQENHIQQTTKTRIQNNHFKLAQPVTLDWNLLKSNLANHGISSISVKPEVQTHVQESGKKIVPIVVRKRKNRSNAKQEVGIVYGKVSSNRRPAKPNHRQEKNIRLNLLPEASTNVHEFQVKPEKENEFSVSASYTVDRNS